jgi:hypothetical protein
MKPITLLMLVLSVAFAGFYPPKTYKINLEDLPEKRFFDTSLEYSGFLTHLAKSIMGNINKDLNVTIKEVYNNYMEKYPERMRETRGVADALNIRPEEVFAIELLYEIDAGCTALVAKDRSGGVILSHNLDFNLPQLFRESYITEDYMKGRPQPLFSCSGIAGYIGVLMCVKAGKFSITINERSAGGSVKKVIANLRKTYPLTTWVMRDALTYDNSYEEAVKRINKTETVSGAYITIAGTKGDEGIILTRNSNETIHQTTLKDNRFLVQCNCDWNNCTKLNDLTNRTGKATEMMSNIPQNEMSLKTMFDRVLKLYPILREDKEYPYIGTISSVFMGPNASKIVSCIYDPFGYQKDCDRLIGLESSSA